MCWLSEGVHRRRDWRLGLEVRELCGEAQSCVVVEWHVVGEAPECEQEVAGKMLEGLE